MKCLTIFSMLLAFWAVLISFAYLKFHELTRALPRPKLKHQRYWGPGDKKNYKPDTNIYDFKLEVDQADIDDLRQQLNRTLHLTEPLESVNFEYGFNTHALRQYVDYWRDNYLTQWREREAHLNKLKQYKTEIQGLKIHFIHEKPDLGTNNGGKKVMPLLLLHGWPGSVREFYDLIPLLTAENNSSHYVFDVVAPSLVGYGFSDAATRIGFNAAEMATVMRNLMLRLGYEQFIVQGGDWGSIIGSNIATLYPQNVIGYHSNFCFLHTPLAIIKGLIEQYYPDKGIPKHFYYDHHFPVWQKYNSLLKESGYFHLQATKPDTIGAAIDSSPVALAAYILEKFQIAAGPHINQDFGAIATAYSLEAVLDNLMIYYITKTATTAGRFYAENVSKAYRDLKLERVRSPVPMGCSRYKNDFNAATNWQLKDKFPNLIFSMYYPMGGHFAALETPGLLYNDLINFLERIYNEDK